MRTFKLVVAYDGTDYFGWQALPEKPSIAAALNKSFARVFKSEIKVLGASRTDAGVHALGQVVRIKTDLDIAADKLKWAWNNSLPADIAIRSLEEVESTFNPFCDVAQKIYHYHFFTERPLPFTQRYGYFYPYKIDFDTLERALQFFVGTHDFRAFRSNEDTREDTVRTIDAIHLDYLPRYKAYRITVKGQKFLRHMIRRIVGASLAVASSFAKASSYVKTSEDKSQDKPKNGHSLESLEKIMSARDPRHTLPNAPAQGLMLYKIRYKEKI
ncbi:MAG TPA: tRNA pseudouridine(38-40) synthase TruA [Candidatus Babeliales bacterium]|nr:tRNA pseudouridine(38-40) synthase TruA [Candidatus Babeliales bacterium]